MAGQFAKLGEARLSSRQACVLTLVGLAAFSTIIGIRLLHTRTPGAIALVPGASPQPITYKPHGDTRSYQVSLLPNGLQMVNVQDESATLSAFGVAVQAGSFDDPDKFPGLAHFCEHMVFLGTERFPDPSGFDNFMSQNGGSNNAFTADEATVYYAEVSSKVAPEGLRRLADFFRAPLFDKKFVEKEVHAIDSEHAKNVQDPQRRILETLNSLANPLNPTSKFHTGDKETLFDAPKKRGENPVDALHTYFADHYCPSRMRLVTVGPEPLHDQFAAAGAAFGELKQGNEACAKQPRRTFGDPKPWPQERLGKWVDIQGTQPQPQLWFIFPLPDLRTEYKSQPMAYIKWVLGYSGENSMVRVLQDVLGLVTSVEISMDSGSSGSSIICIATLTQAGKKNPDAILDVFFAYTSLLLRRGVDVALYQSLATVARLEWDWSEQAAPMDSVAQLAETMMRLPPDRLLSGDSLIESPNAALVGSLLSMLTPANMLVGFADPDMDKRTKQAAVQELPHYGVKFVARNLSTALPGAPERWLSWLQGEHSGTSEAALRDSLSAQLREGSLLKSGETLPLPEPPRPIEGVPTDISLKDMAAEKSTGDSATEAVFGMRPLDLQAGNGSSTKQQEVTLLSRKNPSNANPQVFYRRGWVTSSPKVIVTAAFRPLRLNSEPEMPVEDELRLGFFQRLLSEEMGPRMVDLVSTGVSYDIKTESSGLVLSFAGFAEILPTLINKVLAEMNRGVNVSDASRFNRATAELEEALSSYSEMPISYAIADRNLLLTRGARSREEQLAALRTITAESSAAAADKLLFKRPLHLTALAMGNFAEDSAQSAVQTVMDGVKRPHSDPVAGGQVEVTTPIVKLTGPVELRKKNPRDGDPNDAVVVSLLSGVADVSSRVVLGLLGQIMNPIAFTELRTNMQLGYVVNSGAMQLSNVQGLSVVVQGNVMKADKMEAAVERVYTKLMPERLQNLTDDEFASYKHSFAQGIQQPPLGFSDEFEHFWGPVSQNGDCFGLHDEMLKYLNNSVTSKDVLIQAYNSLVSPASGLRKRMVVKYFAGEQPPARPTLQQAEAIWKEQGVPAHAIERLRDEFKTTTVLDRADSNSRTQLLKEGGYFSTDLKCSVPAKSDSGKSQGASSSPQAATVKTNILAGGSVGPVVAFRAGVPGQPNPDKASISAETSGAALASGVSLVQMKERSTNLEPR